MNPQLSPAAQRLYEVIKKSLTDKQSTFTWLYTEEAERKARLTTEELEAAQLELLRAGVMYIRHGEKQSKYKLVPPEKQVPRDHIVRIGQHRKPLNDRGLGRGKEMYSGSGWAVSKEPVRRYSDEP